MINNEEIKRSGLSNDIQIAKAVQNFAKGLITENELKDYIEKRKKKKNLNPDIVENLDSILEGKLEKEFNDFCNLLKIKSADEIIEKAYEITVKEEMIDILKNIDLHNKEKAIMIDQENLLDELYHDWLDTDIPLGDSMMDSLQESISSLTRYYRKQNKFLVQKGR